MQRGVRIRVSRGFLSVLGYGFVWVFLWVYPIRSQFKFPVFFFSAFWIWVVLGFFMSVGGVRGLNWGVAFSV